MSAADDSLDRLYELLPAVYRTRDAERGRPLQALLRVIAQQVDLVEQDIARLYDNWFIETCQEWVIPYIGDLVGFVPLDARLSPARAEVANTIRFRRRKGTMALLADLATTVSGWPARAVESYRHLGLMQNLNVRHPHRGHSVNLRLGNALKQLGTAFDLGARTIDVRRASSHRGGGRHGVPDVDVFLWRLRGYSLTGTQASPVDARPRSYRCSALGNDVALFTRTSASPRARHVGRVGDVPEPLRLRDFAVRGRDGDLHANPEYYGPGKSLCIFVGTKAVTIDQIVPADLKGWRHRPRDFGDVLVDPERGRLVFHEEPAEAVRVDFRYGFSTEMGGGEYERPLLNPSGDYDLIEVQTPVPGVPPADGVHPTIAAALRAAGNSQLDHVVIEILDSCVYEEPVAIRVPAGRSLQLRAAVGSRPTIVISDRRTAVDRFFVTLESGAQFTMDGLVVAGRGVRLSGPDANDDAGLLLIRHCTLVPGWSLDEHCEPDCTNEPSLELENVNACVRIEWSIVGSIFVTTDERRFDPVRLHVSDSIVDATDSRLVHDASQGDCRAFSAISRDDCELAHAIATILRSTIIGDVRVHAIELGENSLFFGSVRVARRQIGCLRFCYVGPESRTPRRFHCQPDLVEQAVRALHAAGQMSDAERDRRLAAERRRVEPEFTSLRYGMPTYCQLAATCADEITEGADDRSEMGAFHHLQQARRLANLRARLDEYTPAGMDPGIILAT